MKLKRLSAGLPVLLVATTLAVTSTPARGQFVITEMMVNSVGSDDTWEWIEVRNTSASAVDMNGYIAGKLQEDAYISGVPRGPAIINDVDHDQTTIVPAGGVAVLYPGSPTDYNEQLFRDAWQLSPTVPLIAVSSQFPTLTQTGSNLNFGYWADQTQFLLDTTDQPPPSGNILSYDHAAFSLDYSQVGWPDFGNNALTAAKSVQWNGTGDYHNPANWTITADGPGVTTSVKVSMGSTDRGNPGIVPAGTAPAGKVSFTEVMYHPLADQPQWEWVEVFNNTGSTLDFNATPGVFDDIANAKIATANLTSGTIPNGTAAVLFNATTGSSTAGITLAEMQAAWDRLGEDPINFIPVTGTASLWPSLNDTSDRIGLWSSYNAYNTESVTGSNRTMANTVGMLSYIEANSTPANGSDAVPGNWPDEPSAGGQSIYLTNLGSDRTMGANWALSADFDDIGSFIGAGAVTVHEGGDIGTPGTAPGGSPPTFLASDFNHSGQVDATDLGTIVTNFGLMPATNAQGDATGDNLVDGADVLKLQQQLGSPQPTFAAIPEPASAVIGLIGCVAVLSSRRRIS